MTVFQREMCSKKMLMKAISFSNEGGYTNQRDRTGVVWYLSRYLFCNRYKGQGFGQVLKPFFFKMVVFKILS